MPSIAVIGAGVVGLSTATTLKRTIPDAEITVFAKNFLYDTTSIGAGGIFRPMPNKDNPLSLNSNDELRWFQQSANHFWPLAYSKYSSQIGVFPLNLYVLDNQHISDEIVSDVARGFRPLSVKEMSQWPKIQYGANMSTFVVENGLYLPYLMNELEKSGTKFEQKLITNISEINKDFDMVVNCSGLGASSLVGDKEMMPIRGQIFRVVAPWIKYGIFDATSDTYIYPNSTFVVVGGVRQENNSSLEANRMDSKDIWQRAHNLVPSLTGCHILSEWVGLRPGRRGGIRLELEIMNNRPVVHNYGHAGQGVALSWGTAVDAANIAKRALLKTSAKL